MKLIRMTLNCMVCVAIAGLVTVFLLPRLFGYQPYVVISASMQQSFPVGSLIFVRDATPDEIQVGDPITFTTGSMTITHRVMQIDSEKRVFITKGDSNNISEITPFDNLKGKALNFCIPGLGYFASLFFSARGKILTAVVLLCMAALSVVLGMLEEPDGGEDGEDLKETAHTEQPKTINRRPQSAGKRVN